MRVSQLLGEGECLLDPLERLVGIAQIPLGRGPIAEAKHPRVLPVERGRERCLAAIVEGDPLLRMCLGGGKLSEPEQGNPNILWASTRRAESCALWAR